MASLPQPKSELFKRIWNVPGHGKVRLIAPNLAMLLAVDADWPRHRDPEKEHIRWQWLSIMKKHDDGFLVTVNDQLAAAWCGLHARPIALNSGLWYRLDYIERTATYSNLGLFVFMLIAARADELGAAGILGSAFNDAELLAYYQRAGAELGDVPGWNCHRKMVPFCFRGEAMANLRDHEAGLRLRE